MTIFHETDEWRQIRGVQMTGSVRVVPADGRRAEMTRLFRERFALGPEFDGALAGHNLYCFTPVWVRWIDNSRGFGFRQETTLT